MKVLLVLLLFVVARSEKQTTTTEDASKFEVKMEETEMNAVRRELKDDYTFVSPEVQR